MHHLSCRCNPVHWVMPYRMQRTTCPLWSQFSAAGHSWRVHRMLKPAPNAWLQKGGPDFRIERGPDAGCRRGAGLLGAGE
jgi:hypothetical protein